MSNEIRMLEPQQVWNHFADLNEIPRPSKKEEKVIEFAKNFGEKLGLETKVDDTENVIIRKPATKGLEDRKTVTLQAHLDMVCQKNADTDFDFDTQGINMYVDGDWVKADGTTLGSDNGIGVAMIMTILASDDIEHPAIEALFTIDEETGMTGAKGLDDSILEGDILLNIDTEDDDELTIGCAGGIDITAKAEYEMVEPLPSLGYKISVTGLTGGHSGMDIHKGRGNANKIMNRVLWEVSHEFDLGVAQIDGGGLRNAIPRESFAHIAINEKLQAAFELKMEELAKTIKAENAATDPNLEIKAAKADVPDKVIEPSAQYKLLRAIYGCHNGIYRMSPDIADLVQTSNNLARVELNDGKLEVQCLTRSSNDTEKLDLANAIQSCFELAEAHVKRSGDYPGWQPAPKSDIVNVMDEAYEELFNDKANVMACHAGLECGIIGSHYPNMEMISFGPNIRGAHSPDETVQISSVQKSWKLLLETLKRIPDHD